MRVRTRLFTAAAVGGALLAPLVPLGSPPAGAVSTPALDLAVAWLVDQQQPDGGFETVDFPGFETPDAVFALAAAGQVDASWSIEEARATVEGTQHPQTGKDPLDAIDDWVDGVQGDPAATTAAKAAQAAKVIVLVTEPLGLDESDFDPSDDSAEPVDLVGALTAGGGDEGSFPGVAFGGKVYAGWALAALAGDGTVATRPAVPNGLLSEIAAAQQDDGGFNFAGDPDGVGFDPDLTSAVLLALQAETSPAALAIRRAAIIGLGLEQRWTGQWAGDFDDGNANSTAMVMLAAASRGSHPDDPCWRDRPSTSLRGLPYPSPSAAITSDQQPDGRIASPSDAYGVNTFATSQAIQGLAAAAGVAYYRPAGVCAPPAASANRRLVNAMYADLLRRPAEEAGAAYWTAQFDSGRSPAYLSRSFTGTEEHSEVVLAELTLAYLGRVPTATELRDLAPFVRAGARFDVAALLLGGQEYYRDVAGGSDAGWADAVFQDALGRPASSGDVDYVTGRLEDPEGGVSRTQIARSLLRSEEGRRFFVRETYHDLLRREADDGDLAYWAADLKTSNPEWVVRRIIGSAEYRGLTAPPA